MSLIPSRFRVLLATLLLAGCSAGDSLLLPGDGQPTTIKVVDGNGQSGRVGEPLSDPLVVKVTDSRGRPVEGASVAFVFTDAGPGAVIDPETTTTGADGQADAQVTLGTRMGPQTGEARVVSEGTQATKASFTLLALSENANGIVAISGDDQSAPAGSTLPDPLVVEVTDAFGNPISGVPIDWTVQGGGGVSAATVTTDDQGRASVQRQLGPTAGEQRTLASSEGLAGSPVTFTHTATAGNAAGLAIVSGNNQSAAVGTRLPADLVVRLTDGDGNPVAGEAVTWVVSIGGGSVSPENGTTDASGLASTHWTLGPAPGENRVDAVVSGVGVVSFGATGTSSAPGATITTITSDSPDPSTAGAAITVAFRVTSNGPTPTGSVTVTVTGGTANCSGTLQGGTGSCQLTLNLTGDRTLRATYSGGSGLSGSSDTEPHRVNPAVPGNRAPHADFHWHCDDLTCPFTDASTDSDGQVTRWNWDFGDGATSTLREPTHTYPGPGEYEVTLTVTDDDGATDASTAHVEVHGPPPPPENKAPHAEFEVACPNADLNCTFTDKSSDDDGSVTGWHWNFDDGQSSDLQNPSHTYGAAGTYHVTLTVTDNAGGSDSKTHDAHPKAPPPPPPAGTTTTITGDGPDPSDPGVPITVSFTVSSSSGSPVGTVEVTDPNGGGCNGSAPSGSCSYTPTGVGVRTITAAYHSNDNFSGSSDTEDHTVTPPPAGTNTTITADDPDPSVQNAAITVNFTVTSSAGVPNGEVTVSDGTDSCTGSLDGSGQGTCSLALTTAGARTLTATYPGNSSFAPSSDTEDHVVNQPNQAPSFTLKSSDLSANVGASSVEENWAQNISPGPPSESGQTVTFIVTNDHPDLFVAAPAISPSGTLSFTTASTDGDSIVTVQATDDGGTANGGVNTSAPETFTIHISGGGGG